MNYVAHAFLAPKAPIALLGNLLGDFVKGPLPGDLEPELAHAVAQHRALDAECDAHEAFAASRRRLFGEFSHYASVVVDVLYDHLLCKDWSRYANESFDAFAERVYAAVDSHGHVLPSELRAQARRLADVDIMRRYHSPDDLREALRRMSKRLRRSVALERSVDTFVDHVPEFTAEFRSLFDALVESRR